MSLRESIIRRLGVLWWSYRHRPEEALFSLPAGDEGKRHLLIMLPESGEQFSGAVGVLEVLVQRIRPARTTIVVGRRFASRLPEACGDEICTYSTEDATKLGLPPSGILKRFSRFRADIAVSLIPEFCLYTAALAVASGAPIRVSLDHRQASRFFNMTIRGTEGRTLPERYAALLQYV